MLNAWSVVAISLKRLFYVKLKVVPYGVRDQKIKKDFILYPESLSEKKIKNFEAKSY